ncbi:MAG: zinc protease [Limisphaerales bacterium]|jgi:zinc protease
MQTIVRTNPPLIRPVREVSFKKPELHTLSGGAKLYVTNAGEQDIVRIEAIFPGGRIYEKQKGIAGAVGRLMKDGTASQTSAQISETIEQYGAAVKIGADFDLSTLSIHSMTTHLDKLLPVVKDILNNAIFPQKELDTYIATTSQKIKIEEEKNDFIADTGLRASLFGTDHPYGYRTTLEILDNLNREALVEHYSRCYTNAQPILFASGKVDETTIAFLEALFGGSTINAFKAPEFEVKPFTEKLDYRVKAGSVQSAIRLFQPTIDKDHKDYPGLFVLNTLFGGFFGSRLMSNIREDKGYTYGIYSGISHCVQASYFYISSEVGIDVCKDAIKEVHFELNELRNKIASEEELDLVRNYMLGMILGSLDGPLKTSDTVRGLVVSELGFDHVETLVQGILNITPEEIKRLANLYLDPANLQELVVGYPE